MFESARPIIQGLLKEIDDAGLTKRERQIASPQGAMITAQPGGQVLNFCANNYLGLASHPEAISAAKSAMDEFGFGLSSVRFICGTQTLHKKLESAISRFLGTDDTILYSSCFDANGGLFETILGEQDVVISDALNHASIIDGIRLAKCERLRYANGSMEELEEHLKASEMKRLRMIATDGVFSMDGCYAKLDRICDLAERYKALVMVDDSHATGFVGKTGRGTIELFKAQGRVDIITSTLGKALGGASGGFTSGRKEIIDLLRQRSRPYLFSNTLPPPICGAALKVLDMLERTTERRDRLEANTKRFREGMAKLGFDIRPSGGRGSEPALGSGEMLHPIVPVMIGDARLAADMADDLLKEGIYVIGFSYPVVPRGAARIRVQLSAAHETEDIDRALKAFEKVGKARGVIRAA